MHAASREALSQAFELVDATLSSVDNAVAVAAQAGTEIFDVVEVLDGDRGLRIAAADASASAESRAALVSGLFAGKISEVALTIVCDSVKKTWSTPREMRAGLVEIGRRCLLRAADRQDQLEQVEEELFQLGRVLEKEPELTHLLADKTESVARRRELCAKVLYGKVSALTEALVLQVIGRPEHNPIDDIDRLVATAAEVKGRTVAHVVAASELSHEQKHAFADKLGRIYGREMSIHSEVDTSLLGGAVIRVGNEVIDGSTSGKLERLRRAFA